MQRRDGLFAHRNHVPASLVRLSCAPSVYHAPQPSLSALGCPHAALKHVDVQSRRAPAAGPARARGRRSSGRPFPRALGKSRRRALGLLGGDLDAAHMLWLLASHVLGVQSMSAIKKTRQKCSLPKLLFAVAILGHRSQPHSATHVARRMPLLAAVSPCPAGSQLRNSERKRYHNLAWQPLPARLPQQLGFRRSVLGVRECARRMQLGKLVQLRAQPT